MTLCVSSSPQRWFCSFSKFSLTCWQVACYIRIGATTGAVDRSNYLCILSNNLFNQKYFFVLWLWWFFLIAISVLGIVYRFARIMIPNLSTWGKCFSVNFFLANLLCFVYLDKKGASLETREPWPEWSWLLCSRQTCRQHANAEYGSGSTLFCLCEF